MNLKRCEEWVQSHRAYFMDAVRIWLGLGLIFKGIFFLQYPDQLSDMIGDSSFAAVVDIVPYVHIIGGLLMALGLYVRLAALAQIPILFGAVFLVNLPRMMSMQMREGLEFSALVLFLLSLICVKGAGPLTVFKRVATPASNPIQQWVDAHPDVFMDLIRMYLGIGLFVKGYYIMEHDDQLSKLFDQTGGAMFLIVTAAHYAIPAHFAGGALLAMGLLTRVAALAQLPLLAGAVFYVYLPNVASLELRQNIEFTALVLFLLVLITVHGSGRFSVDHALAKGEQDEFKPQPVH